MRHNMNVKTCFTHPTSRLSARITRFLQQLILSSGVLKVLGIGVRWHNTGFRAVLGARFIAIWASRLNHLHLPEGKV